MENKICTRCKKEYPATNEYFYRNKGAKDGFQYHCKECVREWNRQNAEWRNSYYREWNKNNRDKCREQHRTYIKNNPEKKKAYDKGNNDKHRDKKLRQKQEYYQRNRERIKIYRQGNAENISNQQRIYKKNNMELIAEISSRRRARMKTLYTEKVDLNNVYERDNGICHICNKHVGKTEVQYDHVVPICRHGEFFMGYQVVSEHSYQNIKVAHTLCNQNKNKLLMEELYLLQFRDISVVGGDADGNHQREPCFEG